MTIAGASGRMGQALLEAALAEPDVMLAGALDVPASPLLGRDAGERFGRATGVKVSADVPAAVAAADVLIDFTRPEGTLAHVAACARAGFVPEIAFDSHSPLSLVALGSAHLGIPIFADDALTHPPGNPWPSLAEHGRPFDQLAEGAPFAEECEACEGADRNPPASFRETVHGIQA